MFVKDIYFIRRTAYSSYVAYLPAFKNILGYKSSERGLCVKKDIGLWQFGCFVFATALGTVLHFLLGWTDADFLAPVCAVNESTWEHMKILFFPMLFFAWIQYPFFQKEYQGFWWIKLIGTLVGVGSVPIFFYTYYGAFGFSPDWLNIAFFFLSAGLGYFVEWLLFRKQWAVRNGFIAFFLLMGIAVVFVVFTYIPPHLPLFQDPLTKTYGFIK